MIIDTHVHPMFFTDTGLKEKDFERNRQELGLYKTDDYDLKSIEVDVKCAKVDKQVLLPLVLKNNKALVSNKQVADLVKKRPDLFIGFASVNPHSKTCLKDLEYAFKNLKLSGLALHPSKQEFYPNDKKMDAIYKMCLKYNKPIIFHAGISMEPNCLMKYSYPLNFEEVLLKYPKLRICLAHFGWPWVKETAALLLKYPNCYTDTALLYFDDPRQFYHQVFEVDLGPKWLDRSLRHQVMFGSDDPRLERIRMIKAIENMDLRPSTKRMIFYKNAEVFLKGE